MSHLPERKEKICLNCGTPLTDRYCQHCGQENLEPKESFWHLLGHFLEDITHFDGKLFSTLKYLLFRPGFLTKEYLAGRRMSYLNPIRMYLFISALYLVLLMSVFMNAPHNILQSHKKKATNATDMVHDTRKIVDDIDSLTGTIDTTRAPKTVPEYDSLQKTLPASKRDAPFERAVSRKMLSISERFKSNPSDVKRDFKEVFFHSLHYILFISVPLIALIFQLLYIRRRKQFFYVSHIIFVLHFFSFVFIVLILKAVCGIFGGWVNVISTLLTLSYVAYLYIAMLNFYEQKWFKTFIKFFLVLLLGSMILSILAAIVAIIDIWNLT